MPAVRGARPGVAELRRPPEVPAGPGTLGGEGGGRGEWGAWLKCCHVGHLFPLT